VITGGALQNFGEFDNMAEASAAAGILGRDGRIKTGAWNTAWYPISSRTPQRDRRLRPYTASSSGGSYYFIYTYQVGYAITDVDIKAKLALLRGNAAAKQELKDRATRR
jgi:hypothetical protein